MSVILLLYSREVNRTNGHEFSHVHTSKLKPPYMKQRGRFFVNMQHETYGKYSKLCGEKL